MRFFPVGAIAAAGIVLAYPMLAAAQQSQEWFVPNQQRPAAGGGRVAPRPAQPSQPAPPVPGLPADAGLTPGADGQPQQQQVQVQLPPPPDIKPLPKGATPPAAIVGVLSVPDVMRASTAFQQADKEFAQRRQKLNEDAQKEQIALRDLGQQLGNERAKLTPDQIRQRERTLQDRIGESRRSFGERNRIIQEAGQYVMAQIDRAVEIVTQQVAVARGVNLVLNRGQILGTTNEFDLTPQVVEVLNKALPSVVIPPDGVSPISMKPPTDAGATPANATAPAAPATPAAPAPAATTAPTTPAPASKPPAKPAR